VRCECEKWVYHVSVKSECHVSVSWECEKWVSCECEKWVCHVSVSCVSWECEKWVSSECVMWVCNVSVMWVWHVSVSCECECDMWVCHVRLVINAHLSISYFSSILDICKFSFHYYRCWGADCLCSTISSDSIWRHTVNFPFLSSEIKIRHFHKVW